MDAVPNFWTDEGRSNSNGSKSVSGIAVFHTITCLCWLFLILSRMDFPEKGLVGAAENTWTIQIVDLTLEKATFGCVWTCVYLLNKEWGTCLLCNVFRGSRFCHLPQDRFSGTKVVEVEEGVVGAHVACTSVWNSFSGPSEWNWGHEI